MDLAGGFDEVLEMCADEEVSKVDELAMVLVFDIDDAPSILATSDLLAIDDDGLLAPNDRKRDHVLDLTIDVPLLIIELVIVIGVHSNVMEGELFSDALFEGSPLLQCE